MKHEACCLHLSAGRPLQADWRASEADWRAHLGLGHLCSAEEEEELSNRKRDQPR